MKNPTEYSLMSQKEKSDSPLKKLFVGVMGLLSLVYILNPGMGFLEILPDNLPGVGNLDEAAAATLLLSCLAYFGLDLSSIFGRPKKEDQPEPEKKVQGKVVES